MSADQPLDPSDPWSFLIAVLALLVAVLALREAYRTLAPGRSARSDEGRRPRDLAGESEASAAVPAQHPMRCVEESEHMACRRHGESA